MSTIEKSFRKVFPQDKWAQVTGVDSDEPPFDFEGFEESDRCQPIPIDNLPGAMDIEHTQLVNAEFDTNIELIVDKLNSHSDFRFDRDAIIEDVLLNPGPKDDNLDNILREVLNVEDLESFGDDMNEVDTLSMQLGNLCIRDQILDCLKYVSIIKKHDLVTSILPTHQIDEFMNHLTSIEIMAAKCL